MDETSQELLEVNDILQLFYRVCILKILFEHTHLAVIVTKLIVATHNLVIYIFYFLF